MSKVILATLGVALVAIATLIQMTVDWFQSDAMGIAFPMKLKLLTLTAGGLTLLALILSILNSSKR